MYFIRKSFEIAASHRLNLTYESPCQNLHGHNWNIVIYCRAKQLDENGMVVDFGKAKKIIHDILDHKNLNDVLPFNPTAENMANWIVQMIPSCYRADVYESNSNYASFEKDEV